MTEEAKQEKTPKLPPLKKRWECAAKALDMFDGTTLCDGYLYLEGEYCAIGAMLKAAGVEGVDKSSDESDDEIDTALYKEFEKRFGLTPTDVYSVNDSLSGASGEERLLYMRTYTKARSQGFGRIIAEEKADRAVQSARKNADG